MPDATVAVVARANDRTFPTITGPRPTSPWPAELFVALERLPLQSYVWDDTDPAVVWDAAGYVWDDPLATPTDLTDATCWCQGLTIEWPAPDAEARFESGSLAFTLDNRDGRWSQYDDHGRLVFYAPGRRVAVWAKLEGEQLWLFDGMVTRWDETAAGTVDVEAFDAFTRLNQAAGAWNPGTYGDRPGARLAAIATAFAYTGPTRIATGDVTLHSWLTTATPLEEMQAVALSDGGALAVDADGTLYYVDRTWPTGRTDQRTVPVFSDNVCTVPNTVWDLELSTADERIANLVRLTNLEEVTATATSASSVDAYRQLVLERAHDQWVTQAEGDALASYLLARTADAPAFVRAFTLHLHDPQQDLWRAGLDLRRGDLVRLVRDTLSVDGPALLDVNLVATAIRHEITPTAWSVTVGTSRTVGANRVALWDATGLVWDDPSSTPPVWTY